MAPYQDDDILRLLDQIVAERGYFAANRDGNKNENHADERDQILSRLGENARKLIYATQQPHLAFWELIRRV
jgi:hypothetical protein